MAKRDRKRLEIALSDQQWKIVNDTAAIENKPKAVVLKELAFSSKAGNLPSGPTVYADALEAAARSYSGIPRVAMAGIVSAVIRSLAEH